MNANTRVWTWGWCCKDLTNRGRVGSWLICSGLAIIVIILSSFLSSLLSSFLSSLLSSSYSSSLSSSSHCCHSHCCHSHCCHPHLHCHHGHQHCGHPAWQCQQYKQAIWNCLNHHNMFKSSKHYHHHKFCQLSKKRFQAWQCHQYARSIWNGPVPCSAGWIGLLPKNISLINRVLNPADQKSDKSSEMCGGGKVTDLGIIPKKNFFLILFLSKPATKGSSHIIKMEI